MRRSQPGDGGDHALAETINGQRKAELIHRRAPWKAREAVEWATRGWVCWDIDPITTAPFCQYAARRSQHRSITKEINHAPLLPSRINMQPSSADGAHHLEIKVDLVLVNLLKGEQNPAEFLKINPNHRVPATEKDGFVLWESYAIMQYLADTTPCHAIYPIEPRAHAGVTRWLFWCGQHLMPGISILNWEH